MRLNEKPFGCAALSLALATCNLTGSSQQTLSSHGSSSPKTPPPTLLTPSTIQDQLAGRAPARALAAADDHRALGRKIDEYFQRAASQRLYVHLDKPMYQPGEAVWFRVWELATATLTASPDHGVLAELVSPKGATVIQKRLQHTGNLGSNDFELPGDVPGGEYILRVSSDLGGVVEKKLVVSQYQAPLFKKKLEFLRKAYGEGDEVAAAVALHRGTGEALAGKSATAIVTVDDVELARLRVTLSDQGTAVVKFALPKHITRGDGLLTVLVGDGGITESIQKRIPITMKELSLEVFPEGGDLVTGLPGRVYFQARNLLGKPADIEGRVVDDHGAEVARLSSFHNGLGRFELTPKAGRRYRVEIGKPVGITKAIELPPAQAEGCVLQAVDDPLSRRDDLRVAVWCTADREVLATAVLREKRLHGEAYAVKRGEPTVISMPMAAGQQGAVRVTLFSDKLAPLAERLVYRGRGADLEVTMTTHRTSYAPRDRATVEIETRDLAGQPVAADLSLAVVDDAVLSFADDKSAHLLARLYLESEMPGQEIEEPSFYFGSDPRAAQAIDLVLGTQGWRRFDWQMAFAPPPVVPPTDRTAAEMPMSAAEPAALAAPRQGARRVPAAPMARPVALAEPAEGDVKAKQANKEAQPMLKRERRAIGDDRRAKQLADDDWGGAMQGEIWAAPPRQFPLPNYTAAYDGPRNDFRETIFWAPSVKTDRSGKATVSFPLSDAVTSFRATAEGVSAGGLPGRGEVLVQSKLPVSLAVTMPLEATAGDHIDLPVTLANETDRRQEVSIATSFGRAFTVKGGIPGQLSLAAGERRTFFASLDVVGDGRQADDGKASIAIDAGQLKDEVARTIKVVPLGFPLEASLAGTVDKVARHQLDLGVALPGSIVAKVQMYPSPLATMVAGTEAIIREPAGCFEQASSANYPNIMVLDYLEKNSAADPAMVERTQGYLDKGYKMLVGYESPKQGYEWFGGDPGHEALTAYGLLEFVDMARVFDDVDRTMIDRTRAWLRAKRDGKGGFTRNSRALDSFGAASPAVTNGYITYAMTEAGEKDLTAEVAAQQQVAAESKDPYLVALATNTLLNVARGSGSTSSALSRLRGMQKPDGSWAGADHSITRSGGEALTIETTALALLALVEAGDAETPAVRSGIAWLNGQRGGFGNFSSTQATILSLKALSAYAEATRVTTAAGVARLFVNGKAVGERRFEKGHKDALTFDDLGAYLTAGKNTIELRLDGGAQLPYSIAVEYRSTQPASSRDAAVSVVTRLAKPEVAMGEGNKLHVEVENKTQAGQPMALARVGIPGGMSFQVWQLKELKDQGVIDFFETREREVVLYFRSLAPSAKKVLDLELLARVPGTYVAPASSAYLYYTDEHKAWVPPVTVRVVKK